MFLKSILNNQKKILSLRLNMELFLADPSFEIIKWSNGEMKKYWMPCQLMNRVNLI